MRTVATRANEQVVLDTVLQQQRDALAPHLSPEDYFEVFASEQVLKEYDLSYEEIDEGVVDGSDDGGIDAVYVFVNGQLVREDADFDGFPKKGVVIDVYLIQSKSQDSFKEDPVSKLIPTLTDLLNLDVDLDSLGKSYNEALRDAIGVFRRAFLALASSFPKIHFHIVYAARGMTPNAKVKEKAKHVVETVKARFSAANVGFDFLGAPELLQLAAQAPPSTYEVQVAETPISTGEVGFIALVRLSEFARFVSAEDGELRKTLFDANVRDYQGKVEVNQQIHDTLASDEPEDFWWLNNGVTVVATQASLAGKALTLENPQVVNGLQTSTEIHRFFGTNTEQDDTRKVLIRVVVPESDESRDRIIRATNNQTPVPSWALRATDPLQRQIEEFLKASDVFYDRRKNYYKNQGIPKDKIISIPYLAQAVMAIALGEPDNARARPSSLLKSDDDYARIFSADYPIELYLKVVKWMRRVDAFLQGKELGAADRNNLKFHLVFFVTNAQLKGVPSPAAIAKLEATLADEYLETCLSEVNAAFDELSIVDGVARTRDQIAKSNTIVPALKARLEEFGK